MEPEELLNEGEKFYVVAPRVRAALSETDELVTLRDDGGGSATPRAIEAQLCELGLGDGVLVAPRASDDVDIAYLSREAYRRLLTL